MSRVSPLLVALFVLFPLGAARAQVQGGVTPGVAIPPPPPRPGPPRDQSAQATGTAKIRGAVMASDDGRPLRRASVRVSAPELREPRSTVTDLSGRYEIADLPAGRYTVTASRAGFVTISHGQTRPNEMGRPVELGDGQTVERINFSLPRGAAITGRIVDEYGEPVAGASVQPMQMRFVNGRLQPAMAGGGPMLGAMFQTPDTGEFRVWGLAPGEYLLQASLSGGPMPFQDDDRAGYSPTFFPNTTLASEAQVIKLDVGQTASGIEVMLSPIRTARISGTTLDSRGQPLRTGFVSAMAQSAEPMLIMRPLGGQIKPDGTFSISGAAPGTYVVRASAPPTADRCHARDARCDRYGRRGRRERRCIDAAATGDDRRPRPARSANDVDRAVRAARHGDAPIPRDDEDAPANPWTADRERRSHVRSEGGARRGDRARDPVDRRHAMGREISDARWS